MLINKAAIIACPFLLTDEVNEGGLKKDFHYSYSVRGARGADVHGGLELPGSDNLPTAKPQIRLAVAADGRVFYF